MPSQSKHSYLVRVDGSSVRAFVVVPFELETGGRKLFRWLLTDACVLFVPCWYCEVDVGVPCLGRLGHYTTTTHTGRRADYQRFKRRYPKAFDELLSKAGVAAKLSNEIIAQLATERS